MLPLLEPSPIVRENIARAARNATAVLQAKAAKAEYDRDQEEARREDQQYRIEAQRRARKAGLIAGDAPLLDAAATPSKESNHPTPRAPTTPRSARATHTPRHKLTSRKPGKSPDWSWIALPELHGHGNNNDHRTPALAHHSLHTLGFGATRHLVAYGGLDHMGRHSSAVYTVPTW